MASPRISVLKSFLFTLPVMFFLSGLLACSNQSMTWTRVDSDHQPRHEAGMLTHKNQIVLLGGRGERAIEVFNAQTGLWEKQITPALELHHFQPVSLNDDIYIIGALTGPWPKENTVDTVLSYNGESKTLSSRHPIPSSRARGSAGVVVFQGELYMLGGLTNGHLGGSVNWFDKYNPYTGQWTQLPDAPHARDHFQAVVVKNKLYAAGGRQTSHSTGNGLSQTQSRIDVYDFATHTWSTLADSANIPIPRAGNSAIALGTDIVLAGGESVAQKQAHNEVSIFNTQINQWRDGPDLAHGRHGTGFGVLDDYLYTVSGSGNAGGEPELDTYEKIPLAALRTTNDIQSTKNTLISFGEVIRVDINGPTVSETDRVNPFTDYVMQTVFTHQDGSEVVVQGFFAADGNAANSSASRGDIWRTLFTPQKKGIWQYHAKLFSGSDVVFAGDKLASIEPVSSADGAVEVGEAIPNGDFFAANGQVQVRNGYFYFPHTEKYWVKVGANSPENFLAFHEIDGTYRHSQQARDGEAKAPDFIHEFEAHLQDYEHGDPLWQGTKGKGIMGSINYLSAMGMQSQYFLTMNINGDGRDVWPYIDHEALERFDVSKLAQWDMVFQHLNNRNMLIHAVTQETENELFLDGGNTARLRKLYYRELIARFGYHNGLIWNLGEENGPADWSPEGQNSAQRIAMSAYFAQHDPHHNPIFLHTMPSPSDKDNILPPLYASELHGMSFQIDNREEVHEQIVKWRKQSKQNGSHGGEGWAITMDEIGMWDTGAKIDANDPTHDSLRRHALWGALMAGATGVEWYFGAHQPHNDLSSEDFRQRENLWKQTKVAADFFNELPLATLQPVPTQNGLYKAIGKNFGLIYYTVEQASGKTVKAIIPAETDTLVWIDPINGEKIMTQIGAGKSDNNDVLGQSLTVPDKLANKDVVLFLQSQQTD
ncbi:Kelch repeat-containing protein [Alteromonas oceanisediminis]|uniref:Kelch repeat-containing protein n=1 Tax=Alteromonas oceanisediminis TaxID=2836180 RepID=UPI001BDA32AD|nr:DUF5060 domain-containing protein [Alteromonas oceanisediminis]MBT0584889.1 DUF5060 domain-containing protein [Alteromonas oceanisediminis]